MPRYRFSVPSRRGHTDPWFRIGSVDVSTSVLVAGLCVVSFFVYAASPAALDPLILWPVDVRSGQIWRLFTWPIANQPSLFTAISIAVFWYFGNQIESLVGRMKYLWLLLLVAVVPGVVATALDIPIGGIRTVELAIFVVFACEYPKMPFFFGIQAWILAAVFVGIDMLQLIGNRDGEQIILYIVSIATAVWAARSFGMLVALQWLPQIKNPLAKRGKKVGTTKPKTRSAAVVVDGPWPTAPPTYTPMHDQHEVDQILDKIAVVGMDGLSSDEKKRLNDASRRLRKNGQ